MITVRKTPLLTIGILAYNKAPYVKKLLEQIIPQMQSEGLKDLIEVVVSDNASTDSTQQLMAGYMKKKLPYLRYNRNKKNLGFSGNVLKQIELARGRYLWFMGDDEILDNGLKRIIQIIRKYDDRNAKEGNRLFLMSIPNIYDKKVWVSDIDKDPAFILDNSANISTTIVPVAPARKIVKEFAGLNTTWTHNHISLLVSVRFGCEWVLIHNNVFEYMTHPPANYRPSALGHMRNLQSYFDMIVEIDRSTKSDLFGKVNKAYHLLLFIPFLDAFNPADNRKVRQTIRQMKTRYGLGFLSSISGVILRIPCCIRRVFFDLGYVIYGKRYADYRKTLYLRHDSSD